MASVTERARAGLGLPALSPVFLGLVALAPIALGIGRLLPAEGAGLGLRLAAAAACVLLLPGALILRAFDWPRRAGLAIAGSFAWSLAAIFLALVLMFAGNGSLTLAIVVIAIVCAGGLIASLRVAPGAIRRVDLLPIVGVAVGGLVLCGVVWWAATAVEGDGLFHLARVRKLDAFPVVSSPQLLDEFHDGSLHPGYAFPLWHGALALIARFADVDPTLVLLHLSGILAPFALVLAYAAGTALFASWAGGVAAATGQASLIGLQRDGIGAFQLAALPASAARLLIVPALLALVFAYVRGGRRIGLLTIGACALGLATVHPTYAVFVLLPLAGFVVARLVLARRDACPAFAGKHLGRADGRRIALAALAVLVPTALFFAWLVPALSNSAGILPAADEKARALAAYGGQLDIFGGSYRLSPSAIARGGAATVAALLAVPAAVLAGRRRWAAFVLGGSLAVLVVLLTPPFFTAVSDLSSLSQARRLVLFLPLPFALAGAAALLGRLRLWGCALAAAAGAGLVLAYEGGGGGRLGGGGPGWVTWFAVIGAAMALIAGWFVRRSAANPARWAAAAVLVFAIPVAVSGFRHVHREPPDRYALTPGLIEAVRTEVPLRATIFSHLEISYRIAAYAPVYIAAAPPAHVANTTANRPYDRRQDVIRFFFRDSTSYLEQAEILRSYGASWLIVDKTRRVPGYVELLPPSALVYEDGRYALYTLRHSD